MSQAARQKVFVLALAGTSPAVVTELLWHLVAVERVAVVGVELWTTAGGPRSGIESLKAFWSRFGELQASLGTSCAVPDRMPEGTLDPPTGWTGAPFWLVAPRRPSGDAIDDIRTDDDAQSYAAQLHDRVRGLCHTADTRIPDDVELVGGMSGGRKTMGSGLLTAFSLQARSPARLLHVLAHPDVENTDFAFPKSVSESALVSAHEVPFFPLRELLASGQVPTHALDSESYDELCVRLRDAARGSDVARIENATTLVLARGTHVMRIKLAPEEVTVYRLMCRREGADLAAARLALRKAGLSKDTFRKKCERLADKLREHTDLSFWRFVPVNRGATYRVPAWESLE